MRGASAVHSISPCSTRRGPLSVAVMPSTQRVARLRAAAARMAIDCNRSYAASGIITLSSSSDPAAPQKAMAPSLPITCAATMVTDSAMTGFTLPGMIEEPGCTGGIAISAMPARGPQPSRRMSLAILKSATATDLSAPLALTAESSVDWPLKWLAVSRSGSPVASASPAMTRRANSGWVPTPVPTAVPPRGSSASTPSASPQRCRACSTWPA